MEYFNIQKKGKEFEAGNKDEMYRSYNNRETIFTEV